MRWEDGSTDRDARADARAAARDARAAARDARAAAWADARAAEREWQLERALAYVRGHYGLELEQCRLTGGEHE